MNARKIALVALFAALTAVGAMVRIPLWPVPVTLQTLFVLLSGLVLGARLGAMSQIVYITVGLMGLPVFSGGGGPAYLVSPSAGYLLGFVVAAAVTGGVAGRQRLTFLRALAASLAGTAAVYAAGVPYLAVYLACIQHKGDALGIALKAGLAVFLPGDILKCILVSATAPRIRVIRDRLH